jgi:hypothetical protein
VASTGAQAYRLVDRDCAAVWTDLTAEETRFEPVVQGRALGMRL